MEEFRKILHFLATLTPREIALVGALGTSISTWIIGIQMRRKIKRDLGRKATDADLTSINTWMKVDEAEERKIHNDPPEPR